MEATDRPQVTCKLAGAHPSDIEEGQTFEATAVSEDSQGNLVVTLAFRRILTPLEGAAEAARELRSLSDRGALYGKQTAAIGRLLYAIAAGITDVDDALRNTVGGTPR